MMHFALTGNRSRTLVLIVAAVVAATATADARSLFAEGRRAEAAVSSDKGRPASGIEGEVNIRPVRPHQTIGSPNTVPYQAKVEVVDGDGKVVTSFESDANGGFHVALPPGKYVLRPQSPGTYPRASNQTIVVSPGKMTHVQIVYDSGMR